MSFRLEMLQVARLAPDLLGDAVPLVEAFIRSRRTPEGAFGDRDGRADLYYTVFGLEGLLALRKEPDWEALAAWLKEFGSGEGLDFVHLCCLARCWNAVPVGVAVIEAAEAQGLLERLGKWRTPDGGFNQRAGAAACTAYGCLLGWAAHYDLKAELPGTGQLHACLQSLRTSDGGYANEPGLPFGSTPATAAALSLHRHLRRTPDPAAGQWLLAQLHPGGGFKAMPAAPLPDLLSTAVALHGLDGMQVSFAPYKEALLDYIDTLWSAEGGFHGHWADDALDVEYTYYGLLALGHLAL
ncbi:MAG: prenyltransferase/squalene oxidase repeat-containing protein [Verrucomicrobiota bacterium]